MSTRSARLSQVVLPNGRRLGYAEWGPPDGRPVLYFHGVPSCRLDVRMFDGEAVAHRVGARLIAVDRPGCGGSGFQSGRRITDWPSDMAAFANRIGLGEFAVMGWSGGAVYTLACAQALPDRVRAAAVVSGMGPLDIPGLGTGINPQSRKFFAVNRDHPRTARLQDRLMAWAVRRRPDSFMERTIAALPAVDQKVIGRPEVAAAFLDAIRECFRDGPRGGQLDTALMSSRWEFDLTVINVPVRLWHGEQDTEAPAAMGRWITSTVPTCRPRFFADEGHISLLVNHAEEILGTLVGVTEGLSGDRPHARIAGTL